MQVDSRAMDEDSRMDGGAVESTAALSHRVTGVPGLDTQEEFRITGLGRSYLSSAMAVTTGLPAT